MTYTTGTSSGFRSILTATDLTHTADAVLRSAAALAAQTGAELHIVHVIDEPAAPFPDPRVHAGAWRRESEVAVRELEAQIERALPEGFEPASRSIITGRPFEAILQRAGQVGAELLVLGPHRKASVSGFFLGTRADRLVRTSEIPCLIVRDELSLPLRSMAAAIDLSDPARGALDLALRWNTVPGLTADPTEVERPVLRILHVVPDSYNYARSDADRTTAEKILHAEVKAAHDRTGITVADEERVLAGGGAPAEEILSYAAEEKLDLLVLGTHGYGAVDRALVGSVTNAVARRAPCSVLIVPPALWKVEEDHFMTDMVTLMGSMRSPHDSPDEVAYMGTDRLPRA